MSAHEYVRSIGLLAAGQDRLVARWQLVATGVSTSTIDRLLKRGFLIGVFPGVYLVGVPSLSHREFLRASMLLVGKGAACSLRTGLELRLVLPVKAGFATVTTSRHNVVGRHRTLVPMTDGGHGILTVRESALPVEMELVDGFDTTLLPRTLVEFAECSGTKLLARAWREASFRSLLVPAEIERELREHRRPGNDAIRERLRNAYPVTRPGIELRSREGEHAFLELVRELGLPEPLVNVPIDALGANYVGDFFFPDVGLVIETDGGQHELPEQKASDNVRRMDFFAAGIDVLHVSNERLASHRQWCRERVLAAYARQKKRAEDARAAAAVAGLPPPDPVGLTRLR